jgi:hypothetical protein
MHQLVVVVTEADREAAPAATEDRAAVPTETPADNPGGKQQPLRVMFWPYLLPHDYDENGREKKSFTIR